MNEEAEEEGKELFHNFKFDQAIYDNFYAGWQEAAKSREEALEIYYRLRNAETETINDVIKVMATTVHDDVEDAEVIIQNTPQLKFEIIAHMLLMLKDVLVRYPIPKPSEN
jgi:hypothetical protein